MTLCEDQVSITLRARAASDINPASPTILPIASVRIRRGHDIRLVVAAPSPPTPKRDARLVQLVAEAVTTRIRLQIMGSVSTAQAAAWLGCCRLTLTERIKLSYLAPDIVEAILAGRQPRTLTRRRLANIDLPIDWQQQRQMLGFALSPAEVARPVAAPSGNYQIDRIKGASSVRPFWAMPRRPSIFRRQRR